MRLVPTTLSCASERFNELASKFVGPLSKLWCDSSGMHSVAKCCSGHLNGTQSRN